MTKELMDKILAVTVISKNLFFLGTVWIVIGAVIALAPYCVIALGAKVPPGIEFAVSGLAGCLLIVFGLVAIPFNVIRILLSLDNRDKINGDADNEKKATDEAGNNK